MNGAQVFFYGVAYGQFLSAVGGGSGGSGDEPNRPWRPKSAHEADAVPAALRNNKKRPASSRKGKDPAGEGRYPCPICHRLFDRSEEHTSNSSHAITSRMPSSA